MVVQFNRAQFCGSLFLLSWSVKAGLPEVCVARIGLALAILLAVVYNTGFVPPLIC